MKVLIYSIAYYPHVGGAEVAIKEITDRLENIEWDMVTVAFDKTLPEKEKVGNVTVHRVRCPKFLFPFVGFWKGRELYQQKKYDAVWSMMTYAGFAGLFTKLAFPEVTNILTLQEGTPLSEIKLQAAFVYPLFWLMFKKADMIQAISHFLATFGRDMGHPHEVIVVPNGVDLKYFAHPPKKADVVELQKELGKEEGEIYLVSTSRLVHKNAMDDCIRALEYLPAQISLLIIGVGEEEGHLRTLARRIGMRERVKFLGHMPYQKIPLFLAASDIFVRPSRSEGFGNSFIEAMAAGLPVVATPVGGIPDFIDDHETGIFCRPDNPKSLAEAVMEFVHNTDMTQRIIRQAHDRAVARYGWERIAKEMREKVFNRVRTQ